MKKILLLLIILVSTFFVNGTYTSADNSGNNNPMMERFKRQFYLENMVKEIESESEVKIPDYVDMRYIEYMYDLGKKLEIPTRLTFRLVFKESSFIDTVKSHEGANGFMQLMPATEELYANALQIDTLHLDLNQRNIYIGLNMLKDLYNYWNCDKGKPESYAWKLSLASYNAGIGKVLKYNGIPPYQETLKYIEFILREHSLKNEINYLATK
jgi:soluble lytic murein transglycosylase-like protein